MAENGTSFTEVAKGITSIINPLARAGSDVYLTQQRAEINRQRIKQGKRPCDRTYTQPPDCPTPLFSPRAGAGQLPPGQTPSSQGGSGMLWLGLLVVGGAVAYWMLSRKESEG